MSEHFRKGNARLALLNPQFLHALHYYFLMKECLCSLKVLDHDENVVHSLKRHVISSHF